MLMLCVMSSTDPSTLLFLALPNTENWSKKLHRIYLGKDRTLKGVEMHMEVVGKPLLLSRYQSKK